MCPTDPIPRRDSLRSTARVLAGLLLFLPGPAGAQSAPSLEPIPELDLSVTGAGARRQLAAQRAAVERLLSGGGEPERLAGALGDLGRLYVVYDFLEPAGICFNNARRLAGADYRWSDLLGYVRALPGRLEPAVDLFRQTLELSPGFAPAAVRLGRAELGLGRPESARAAFERAVSLDDALAAAHEGLGKAALLGGEAEAALRHLERALELDPGASAVHYALAQAHRGLRQLDQARLHLERAGDVAARFDDPLIHPLADLAKSAQFYLVQGAEALEDGDYESAATAFSSALEHDSTSFPAYRGLAISLGRLGDRDGARRALEQALQRAATGDADRDRRERAGIHRSLGLLEADAGRGDRALTHYLASLDLNGDQPDLLLRAGNALARGRRFAEAVERYDRLLELDPEWAPVVLEKRATALINLGRSDQAVADFSRAIEAAPRDVQLRLRFARALEFLGQAERAAAQRSAAERLAADGAGRVALLLEAARGLRRGGDLDAAAERYREVLELAPEHREARIALAAVLAQANNHDEAAREYRRVIAGSPRHAPAHRGLIASLVLAERYGEGRLALQQALRAFPLDVDFALTQVRLLATAPDPSVRDGALALEIARRVHAERRDSDVREALALAHAAAGDFDRAAELVRELIGAKEPPRTVALRARLAAFKVGEAWTARSPGEILGATGTPER